MRAPAEPTLTEEACLDEVMRLRFTGAPCAACGDRQGFLRESRNRAYSCRSCGLKIFPCQGTPFVKPRPSLVVWFEAIDLVARTGAGAGVLRRRLKVDPRTAADIEAGIGRLKAAADPATDARWFPEIATFVHGHRANGRPAVRRDETGPETLWESLCAIASHAPAGHRPYLGLVAIAALMMVGVGVGWLIVPQAPEPDEEIEQATATLTLGEDKPVIIVSADLAAQLYDVTDVDADPTSPLASSIRVAPRAGQKGPGAAPDAQSLAPPAVKLSAGAGKSLVEG
ncbi:MAG: hypothetical protein INR70_30880, partial [Parafilimonas terrae]|nr:hypothetical protein [Parafilimonas terrae]